MPTMPSTRGGRKDEVVLSFCNECGHETNHTRLLKVDRLRTEDVDEFTVEFGTHWFVLQCSGCEEVTVTKQDWCSEDDTDHFGRRIPSPKVFFPPRSSRRKPDWMKRLAMPDADKALIEEIYFALQADSRRIAMMGARALIDAFVQRNVGDRGDFKHGLDALVQEKFLGEKHREVLEAAVDVGHASGHRAHNPDSHTVATVMDIVENLIHDELLRGEKDVLRSKTPPRPQRKKDPK